MAETCGIFGSCVLFKEVHEDDLGRLFRAGLITDRAVDRIVWLRILDAPGLPQDAIIEAFDQAREIGRAVVGAQLPARPFFVQDRGVPALGSDHVAGQPLNRFLQRARDEAFPLQPDNALLIVDKLAVALAAGEAVAIGGHPLVHGFLHPGLVLLTNDGDAVVSGFGVGGALLGALDQIGAVAGVRAYLAPEVLAGGEPSPRSEVYSLGAILFHLLTGSALPVAPEDRGAAFDAAYLAWDGELMPNDIHSLLGGALAPSPSDRFASAAEFRTELERLLYGGAYSPTTFNLALFMDRLFRSEIEDDEVELEAERETDLDAVLDQSPVATEPVPVKSVEPDAPGPTVETTEMPEAMPPTPSARGKRMAWAITGGIAIVAVVAGVFWLGRESGPRQPPPTATPTAAEIAARRLAQEERLRTLTQEMVKEMMAEREEEIRQELIARQTRIDELQRRLQQSERRAAKSAAAAADEAATQQALMREIEEQEQAQKAQQDALEAERREALDDAAGQTALATTAAGTAVDTAAVGVDGAGPGEAEVFRSTEALEAAAPTPLPIPSPQRPKAQPTTPAVAYGDFIPPEEADTLPVVIKSQALEWPRNAARSRGKGVVVVQLQVNADGGVDQVEVLRADHTGWGIPEAAVEAASGYRFKPGTKDGVPITTNAFVTWRYDFTEQ